MEGQGRTEIIAVLIIIVHRVNFGKGILECLEVTIEHGLLTCALLFYQIFDAEIGLISPSADTDFHTLDTGRPCFQRLHVIHIVRLGGAKDILTITANHFAVGSQRAVCLDIDIEKDDISES